MKTRIYLDYNATAPVHAAVRAAVEPLLFGSFGNASSVHWAGQESRRHLEAARHTVATLLGRKASEIAFTSGGSESNNWALTGLLRPGDRLITSAIEHPATLRTAAALEARGVEVDRVPVEPNGQLDLAAFERSLSRGARLVSIMAVNNETGVVQPIEAVIALSRAAGAFVHVDAVQAAGRIALPVAADLLSLSSHKLGGLKGSGVLALREHLPLAPLIYGGAQERGRRAGTEPVFAAAATACALSLSETSRAAEMTRLAALRDRLETALLEQSGVIVLGRDAPRVAQTTTACFDRVEGESLLQALDLEGVAASSGSACSSGSLEPSHVLLAMGLAPERALSALRFSLGHATTEDEIDALIALLPRVLSQVRN